MVLLRTFWTPCFFYEDVREAITPISIYTAMASLIAITYSCYVMNGGDSSQFYMPYFETDIDFSTQVAGGLAIVFFLLFFGASIALRYGVNNEIRGFIIPWLVGMSGIIIYQLYTGFHWLFGYYIYLDQIFALICMWIWMCYNMYCLLAVYSSFQILTEKQSPDLVIIDSIGDNQMFYWDESV